MAKKRQSKAAEAKAKLAGEVYDLLICKHTPEQRKNLPTRESFIHDNMNDIVIGGRNFGQTSIEDLKKAKKNLLIELGKSKPTDTKKSATSKPTSVQKQSKPAPKPAKSQPAKAQTPKTTTYTVKGKTFATLAEAKAFKALQKQNAGKPCEIKEGTRKPTHKVVSFTAKKL